MSIKLNVIDKLKDSDLLQWALSGDGDKDKIKGVKENIAANKLKPAQNEIFFGKSMGMAVVGTLGIAPTVGGYLGSVWSQENNIMDGHHRWASTMLGDPTAKIGGYKIKISYKVLIPILRKVGRLFGKFSDDKDDKREYRKPNKAGDVKGDINLYKATPQDVVDFIHNGKFTNEKFYKKENGIKFLEKIGGIEVLQKRLVELQKIKPPADAPPRVLMPVIRGKNTIKFPMKVDDDGNVIVKSIKKEDEEKLVVDLLNKGKINVSIKEGKTYLNFTQYLKFFYNK